MSRVFSAKLSVIAFEYEIGDKKAGFEYRSPTTLEIDEAVNHDTGVKEALSSVRAGLLARLKAIKGAFGVAELIADQEQNGNLYDLYTELEKALAEEKNEKKRG
jgi:hypothetical protein